MDRVGFGVIGAGLFGENHALVYSRLPGVQLGERRADRLVVHLDGTAPEALNRQLVAGGVRVRELRVERPSLEDVFLKLTGERHAPG